MSYFRCPLCTGTYPHTEPDLHLLRKHMDWYHVMPVSYTLVGDQNGKVTLHRGRELMPDDLRR